MKDVMSGTWHQKPEIPISQPRKRPGSYPILPPPWAIPYPIPTIPKPDLPEKTLDPGLKTGYSFTLSKGMRSKLANTGSAGTLERRVGGLQRSRRAPARSIASASSAVIIIALLLSYCALHCAQACEACKGSLVSHHVYRAVMQSGVRVAFVCRRGWVSRTAARRSTGVDGCYLCEAGGRGGWVPRLAAFWLGGYKRCILVAE